VVDQALAELDPEPRRRRQDDLPLHSPRRRAGVHELLPSYGRRFGAGSSYRIGANTEWAPYGQQIWYPNVATTWINPGEWHRIEFYYRWETTPGVSGDGIIRWWVDGTLNGDQRNVHYPAVGGFEEFQFAPTVQFAGVLRYMYVDHAHISLP